ncbi:MAG: hypothetical protein IJH63_10460 [Methanobrevibacter sp.]|nr:hypothetical protein [Methanosphaera sp.]MBR0371122.1 hypothetical protein [Methanobrevibacter sp.]
MTNNKAVTKAVSFMTTDVEQEELLEEIKQDIKKILATYDFKKVTMIVHSDVGEISVYLQEDFPSKLIKELNEYMGSECTINHKAYDIQLKWITGL